MTADRYARQRLVDGWNQERLVAARVMVAGAGAIGSEVVKGLALVGVGQLLVADFDTLELSNLSRGALYRDADIGRPKAEALAARVRELNPEVSVSTLVGDIEFDLGLQTYATADLIIGCLDSVNGRLALNRLALRAGTPWINTGIGPSAGEVALFSPEGGICYECCLSEAALARSRARYSCGGLAASLPAEEVPTTAPAAAAIAALAVNEAVCLLHTNPGEAWKSLWPGQRAFLNLSPPSITIADLAPNPYCLAHEVWSSAERTRTASQNTVQEALAGVADRIGHRGELSLGFDLLVAFECPECEVVERVLEPAKQVPIGRCACPRCGARRRPGISNAVSESEPLARLTLGTLGIPSGQWLRARGPAGEAILAVDCEPDLTLMKKDEDGRAANQPHYSPR